MVSMLWIAMWSYEDINHKSGGKAEERTVVETLNGKYSFQPQKDGTGNINFNCHVCMLQII